MQYTEFQKTVLKELALTKVNYRDMWKSKKELGYSSIGDKNHYEVNIAADYPDETVKDIILLHELGHVFYEDVSVNLEKEFASIEELFKKNNKPFEAISVYGGPHSFINICMDLRINGSVLTVANNNYLKKQGLTGCTCEAYKLEYSDDFRDYYEALIQKIDSDEAKKIAEDQKKFQEMLQDLAQAVDECSKEISNEVANAISQETYTSGESKSKEDDIVDSCTAGQAEYKSSTAGKGIGSSHFEGESIDCREARDKEILKFIASIVGDNLNYRQDAMRHYNRGTRRNSSGILYNSIRRQKSVNQRKIAFLLDVSGSMDINLVMKAISSLKGSISKVSPESIVALWDVSLIQEFPVTKIPSTFKMGGGTEMSRGVEYLAKKGFDEIVLYSDYETSFGRLERALEETGVKMYSIVAGNKSEYYEDFVKKNSKKYIFV